MVQSLEFGFKQEGEKPYSIESEKKGYELHQKWVADRASGDDSYYFSLNKAGAEKAATELNSQIGYELFVVNPFRNGFQAQTDPSTMDWFKRVKEEQQSEESTNYQAAA